MIKKIYSKIVLSNKVWCLKVIKQVINIYLSLSITSVLDVKRIIKYEY